MPTVQDSVVGRVKPGRMEDHLAMGVEAVKLFDQEIASAPSRPEPPAKPNEPDVPSVAKELLPTIKNHLAEAEKIQKALK